MTKLRLWRLIISIVAVVSLLLNGLLIVGLLRARNGLVAAVAAARNTLARANSQPVAFEVAVDQAIPIRADVPIDEVFVVPLDFVYPLDTVVNTYVDIPLLGRQDITVPVETVIPISHTLEVPIRMSVPISVTYRLQAEIPVEVALPPELAESLDALLVGLTEGLADPLK